MFGLFKKKTEPAAAPAGTDSFRATGISFNCRFPSSRFKGRIRQFVLDKCRTGDPVTLKIYEWEGAPALAVMADKYETDIGVAGTNTIERYYDTFGRSLGVKLSRLSL